MPAHPNLSLRSNLTEVLAHMWAAPGHTCRADSVRANVRQALLEMVMVDVAGDGEQLRLTEKGIRHGKRLHDVVEMPHWMLDTADPADGGDGFFHAFESYGSAIAQEPVLCGRTLVSASDYVMPGREDQTCPRCRPLAEAREAAAKGLPYPPAESAGRT